MTCGNGMILNNVMYIGLNADMLNQLTYPDRAPELKSYSVEVQETMDFVKGGTDESGYFYEPMQGVGQIQRLQH